MKKLLNIIPTWNTFLLYIGGIPTLITTAILIIIAFITARNKAFSITEFKSLHNNNKSLINKENALRIKVLNAPIGIQKIYRWYIGETNYYDLVNRR